MAEQQPDSISPERIIATLQGFMRSAALRTGLEFEVFTHIAHGVDTAEGLAERKKVTPRAMRILCDALAAFGVLGKSDGRYELPPTSRAMLVKGSPRYIGATAQIMANPVMWNEAARLSEIVRAGHSLIEHGAETPDAPFWQDFARASRQMAAAAGPTVAETAASLFDGRTPRRILDIACGSGLYGLNALKRFAASTLVATDWPGVLKLAEPNAHQMGLADRVEFRPGDIFSDDLGTDYDLVLAVNIYHHFSLEKCAELTRRLYEATAPEGALVIVDAVADDKRETERFALLFALTMLIWTREGDTYTLAEYRRVLEASGYHDVSLKRMDGPMQLQAVVARK